MYRCDKTIKFGVTERGDPSLDMSWVAQLPSCDAAIIITKNLTDQVIAAATPFLEKLIFHVTCTGFAKTVLEPNSPMVVQQLSQAKKLLDMGMETDQVVIRIDPIIPTEKGLKRADTVFKAAYSYGFRRFRVSLLDCYPHVRQRMLDAGIEPPYGRTGFSPHKNMVNAANSLFRKWKEEYPNISVESCAEAQLAATERVGCVSKKDFDLFGLTYSNYMQGSGQRSTCLCCAAKTELLSKKKQCAYKCMYCYWR